MYSACSDEGASHALGSDCPSPPSFIPPSAPAQVIDTTCPVEEGPRQHLTASHCNPL